MTMPNVTLVSSDGTKFVIKESYAANLSQLVKNTLRKRKAKSNNNKTIKLKTVHSKHLELIVKWLNHHEGRLPDKLQWRGENFDVFCLTIYEDYEKIRIRGLVSDPYDANFIDYLPKVGCTLPKEMYKFIIAARDMKIDKLLTLMCTWFLLGASGYDDKHAWLFEDENLGEVTKILEEFRDGEESIL